MGQENGANLQTIIDELLEPAVGVVSFADLTKRDVQISKALRPPWNNEEPKDYSVPVDVTQDIDTPMFKAVTGRVNPDETTKLIVEDVLRRLASDGDDFRRTDPAEHAENHDDDEPSDEDHEFSDAFVEFCARR
jgi:hypothetical protein